MLSAISFSKQELRVVAALASIFVLRMLGLCMLLPVFALEAQQYAYANEQLIGFAIGAYGLAQAVLQIPFGILSDRFGRLKIIGLGLFLLLLGSLIAANAQTIYGLILGRILQGAGAIGSVVIATVADHTREQVRTLAMAILGISIGMAFVLAMIIGPWITQAFNFKGVFWFTMLLAIGGILLLGAIPKTATIQTGVGLASLRQGLRSLITDYKLLNLNFGIFVLHATLAAMFLVLPLIINQAGYTSVKLWQLYSLALVVALPLALNFISAAEKRQQVELCQILAISCLLLTEISFALISSRLGIFIVLSVFFSGFCILEASLPTLVSKAAPAAHRGAAMGVYSSLQFLGVFFGGIMGGWLHGKFGMQAVLLFCMCLALTWLGFAIYLREQAKVKLNLVEL